MQCLTVYVLLFRANYLVLCCYVANNASDNNGGGHLAFSTPKWCHSLLFFKYISVQLLVLKWRPWIIYLHITDIFSFFISMPVETPPPKKFEILDATRCFYNLQRMIRWKKKKVLPDASSQHVLLSLTTWCSRLFTGRTRRRNKLRFHLWRVWCFDNMTPYFGVYVPPPPLLRAEWQSVPSRLSSVLTTAGEHMAAGPPRALSSPTPDLPMTLTLYLGWMSRAQTPKASVSACDRRGFEHSVNTCQGVSPPHSFWQF